MKRTDVGKGKKAVVGQILQGKEAGLKKRKQTCTKTPRVIQKKEGTKRQGKSDFSKQRIGKWHGGGKTAKKNQRGTKTPFTRGTRAIAEGRRKKKEHWVKRKRRRCQEGDISKREKNTNKRMRKRRRGREV